jgi:hypothetical protein
MLHKKNIERGIPCYSLLEEASSQGFGISLLAEACMLDAVAHQGLE